MLDNAITMILIILAINIVYVSFATIRTILTLKGQKYIAAAIGTVEIMVYTLGLGLVLDNLDRIENLLAYGLGYGIGVIVGSKIEERLALGYITVNVISSDPDLTFTKQLRDRGYGVTSWYAYGMDGDRLSMQILTPRKYELNLYELIKNIDPKAFIISYEPKSINGGFWVKQVKKGKIKRSAEEEYQEEPVEESTAESIADADTKERTLHKRDE
ncbi:uncharacterized protein YebE (UPF0316 family) [Streptohalobacillus salinus]|uniref:UPF0316 protein DES38_10688 n=1 Tax=Streptohalobacillus salinus TaxID=621096 RepID=A0A2V3W9L6_9BACI|nr:DUF2179 domain-containing protein [Streptohalobacillus salinus]PXW91053.1 uncharacterized protein YebE (UPF0316 family) [Streptohalobacillus salinus]